MTTLIVPVVTDELIAELEAAANAATPQDLDSAEEIIKSDPGAMIECPVCGGEGYASIENDYCNFDNHAIGVQFYGIGPEFGAGERYFRAANPTAILALLAERADLKLQLAAASVDVERFRLFAETVVAECSGQEMTTKQATLFGCMNSVTSVSMDGLIEMFDAALAIAAD